MKFGLLYEIEVLQPWDENSHRNAFMEALEQIKLAEEVGFDYVWEVEHHFLGEFSISSAPEVFLSAVAQHTSRIRIGHGVALLPFGYNHPIRVAERAAVLDIMSNGRLEFGTGRSATQYEMEAFGVDPETNRAEWDEAVRMIPKMWTQDEFSWDSELMRIPTRNVLPKPLQKPHPPMWMAGTQPSSAILAAERGLGFLHFTFADPKALDEKVQGYRDGIAKAEPVGSFVNENFAAFTLMHCGETDDEAMREGGGGADWYVRASNLLYSIWAHSSSKSYAWYAEQFAKGRGGDTEDVNVQKMADEGIICLGGPEKCAQVVRHYEEQGIDQIIFLVQAGGTSDDAIQRSLRLFGEKVIPQFK
ncbi:MAG: LLM class flavin-dependent oxidoreductase [Chloroflexi bacterium]|nr:LLM class flavin-dependent oxidoreductase [Chloroflexota bacterium]MCI0818077.1 LLM class flavin-dependent oxidoreductase [Chloroflexota bacterium]MCI0838186.1 LLM class flavin-dependent oxidoreductase [Chloroflexota bacterium]